MLFNSMAFAIFLPIVFILYWVIPAKYRWAVMLAASCYFYMSWDVRYIVLILFTTAVTYTCALGIDKVNKAGEEEYNKIHKDRKKKKLLLLAALTAGLGLLFFFKYFLFVSNSIVTMLNALAIPVQKITLSIMLPAGISFYTFQSLAYVMDVYHGKTEAERHFGKYAAFITFFPVLLAGPIERSKNLLPQIKGKHTFDYEMASYGVKLIVWGFLKKLIIADNLAIHVNKVYGDLESYSGFSLVLVVLFFALQIYCDFSGYSDIAIGTARLFGIKLMDNFRSPYFSASIREFWSRWHISLSTWFRDHLYIPLGGNRVSKLRQTVNLMITFLVSGLWHGAAFHYVVWGGVHGAAQSAGAILLPGRGKEKDKKVRHNILWWLSVGIVFIFCCLAWIFFRADNLADAIYVLKNMPVGIQNLGLYINTGVLQLGIKKTEGTLLIIVISMLAVFDYLSLRRDVITSMRRIPKVVRWMIYIVILLIVFALSPLDSSQEFIYFEF